jgi:superfamily I DNA/RNA helicase
VVLLQGSRPLQEFIAHVALNPHTEQAPQKGKRGSKQQQQAQADALVISTIHAAKGLEYGCVWVVRWVDGFLPAHPRE